MKLSKYLLACVIGLVACLSFDSALIAAPPLYASHSYAVESALPATLPAGVIEIDSRGFAKLAAIEAERASNPLWRNAPEWWAIEGLPNESFEVRANLTEAKFLLFLGVTGDAASGTLGVNSAFHMTEGPPVFGYSRGLPYPDARSFIGDNYDSKGNLIYRGLRPADIPAFVAACNANYLSAIKLHRGRPQDAIPSTVR